jgi:hypothetical protein
MRVVSHNAPEYTLLNLINMETMRCYIKLLKPFIYDPTKDDPIDIMIQYCTTGTRIHRNIRLRE